MSVLFCQSLKIVVWVSLHLVYFLEAELSFFLQSGIVKSPMGALWVRVLQALQEIGKRRIGRFYSSTRWFSCRSQTPVILPDKFIHQEYFLPTIHPPSLISTSILFSFTLSFLPSFLSPIYQWFCSVLSLQLMRHLYSALSDALKSQ